jgi:hypothetical protein
MIMIRKIGISFFQRHSLNIHRSITFRCSEDSGAVLSLPKGAIVYEEENRCNFQTYAARHAVSWYEYMLNAGMDVSNGSLYFVTECTKSTDWGIAVFYAQSMPYDHLQFIFDQESYQWRRRGGKVEARVGSKSTDNFDSDTEEPNQCVFLRGYKIMLRQDVWDQLTGAIVVTSEEAQSSSSITRTISNASSHGTSSNQFDSCHQSSSHNPGMPGPSHYTRLQAYTQAPQDDPMRAARNIPSRVTIICAEVCFYY